MSSYILWALIAFLVVDVVVIFLVASRSEDRTRPRRPSATTPQAPAEAMSIPTPVAETRTPSGRTTRILSGPLVAPTRTPSGNLMVEVSPRDHVPTQTPSGHLVAPLTSFSPTVQPATAEHIFTLELEGEPTFNSVDSQAADGGHTSNPVLTAVPITKDSVGDQQRAMLFMERTYLRQRANTLETRLATLNDGPDATTDFRRGMRAALEEELHEVWARLSELEVEENRVNHVGAK